MRCQTAGEATQSFSRHPRGQGADLRRQYRDLRDRELLLFGGGDDSAQRRDRL